MLEGVPDAARARDCVSAPEASYNPSDTIQITTTELKARCESELPTNAPVSSPKLRHNRPSLIRRCQRSASQPKVKFCLLIETIATGKERLLI